MSVDFLPFATGSSANVESQSAYASDASTANGFSAGIASSSKFNKAMRQATFGVAALANWIAQKAGVSVADDGQIANFVGQLSQALAQPLFAVATGSANALVASVPAPPASVAVGTQLIVKAIATNTAAATIDALGLGAKPILLNGRGLAAGAIKNNLLQALLWNGTAWELQAPTVDGIIAYSLEQTGYEVYSHGKIVQWGVATIPPASSSLSGTSITFPISFPNLCFGVLPSSTSPSASGWDAALAKCPAATLTTSGCTLTVDTVNPSFLVTRSVTVFWRAEGN